MSVPKGDFDIKKVTMDMVMHLNGGKEYNKCMYDIKYGKKKIGSCVRGREGKEKVNMLFIGEETYDLTKMEMPQIEEILREACQ